MYVQRAHRLYEYAGVVLQDLAENFVYLHRITLGAFGASELALIHPSAWTEGRAPKLAGDREVLT